MAVSTKMKIATLIAKAQKLSHRLEKVTGLEVPQVGPNGTSVLVEVIDPMGNFLVGLKFNGDCQFEAALEVVVMVMRQQNIVAMSWMPGDPVVA